MAKLVGSGYIKLNIPFGKRFLRHFENGIRDEYVLKESGEVKIGLYTSAIITLSLIDGALIFDKELNLIAAGAILNVETDQISGNFGSRHKAGFAFCNQARTTVVCIISQDGTVTLVHIENLHEFVPEDLLYSINYVLD